MRSMLCPVLIGRAAELQSVTDAIDHAASGAGGVTCGAGDAGVGRSRLVREAAAHASSLGFHVLIGRSTESALPVAFRPVAEALMKVARAGVMPDGPELANYRPALATLVPEWGPADDGSAELSPLILALAIIPLLSPPCSRRALLAL